MSKAITVEEKLDVPKVEMLSYMGGFVGQNLSYNLIVNWVLIFYIGVVGIEPIIVGTILSICKIIDAFTDLIAGSLMDKHTFKNGEKLRPFLKLIPIPVGIFACLMFINFNLSPVGAMIYLFVVYLLWDIFYSLHDVALWGMSAMVSGTESGRNKVAQWSRIACSVGGWLPALIPFVLGNGKKLGINDTQIYLLAGIFFGLGGMLISMTASKAKERIKITPHNYTIKEMIMGISKNKILLCMVISNIICGISFTVPSYYFYKFMVNYDFSIFGFPMNGLNVMAISGIICGIPGLFMMFVAVKFAKKFGGMKNVILLACFINIGLRLVCFIVGYDGWKMVFLMFCTMLIGIPSSLVGIANTSLWGDAINYHEYKTNQRNEGLTFACQNLSGKAAGALGVLCTGIILSALKYSEKDYENNIPPSEIFNKWIWAVFILGPIISSLLQAIPLLLMKYPNKEREIIEKALIERRLAEKEQAEIDNEDSIIEQIFVAKEQTDIDTE